ncbi:hypothetical protein Esti_006180 [Eimeria stiedai]
MHFPGAHVMGSQTVRTDSGEAFLTAIKDEKAKRRPQTSTGVARKHVQRPPSRSTRTQPPLSSSYACAPVAEYTAALCGARKSRNHKFQARFTFSHSDPKYYSELPVQPATGWWKSLIRARRHSPALVDRLCKSVDILVPDAIYTTSTESYYLTNSPLALESSSARAQKQLTFPEDPRAGWFIQEDFSASKLFERNVTLYLALTGCPSQSRRRSSATLTQDTSGMVMPAAVMKQPQYASATKNVAKALDLPSTSGLLADSSAERLVQVFVHGKRLARCQLTRVAWRAGNMPIGFTFVNKLTPEEARRANLDLTGQFCVSCDNSPPNLKPANAEYDSHEDSTPAVARSGTTGPNSTFDVFSLSGASLNEASEIARKLLLLTQTLFKLWLDTLVVDLIKASNGKWYFLQVKSFKLRQTGPRVDRALLHGDSGKDMEEEMPDEDLKESAALRKQQMSLTQPSICAMCGLKRSKKALNRMMNHRMMLEAQHHMRKRGVDILFFHQTRRQQLSAESAVCGTCYSLYLAEKELIQLEAELARETGQQISRGASKLCFVTGILDAIQGSFLMKDPDLLELLQAFENSCQSGSLDAYQGEHLDEASEETKSQPSDQDILAALHNQSSMVGSGILQRGSSDLPPTRDAQGGLITFRGGEAIHSRPADLVYDIALPAALHQWRLMLFLDSLQDPPPCEGSNSQQPYLLQLGLFGQTSLIILPVQDEHGIVRIRRMLIFYLFSKKPIVTEIFKEELQFYLLSADCSSTARQKRVPKARVQSAGAATPAFYNVKSSDSAESFPEASPGQALAVGSCSLGRLAGKRSVKNQTYVLLFEGDNGRCRLHITLGLHRDMQVPSQYVSVVPFRDAFLSRAPYCCSSPLPPEWLDCFLAPSDS